MESTEGCCEKTQLLIYIIIEVWRAQRDAAGRRNDGVPQDCPGLRDVWCQLLRHQE